MLHVFDTESVLSRNGVSLRLLSREDAVCIADLLNRDDVLRAALASGTWELVTGEAFYENTTEWCARTNSLSFAIMYDGVSVGMISLSHIDDMNHSARVGYWVASECWGQGVATRAFACLISLAREHDIRILISHIDSENTASRKIWKRYDAKEIGLKDDQIRYELRLTDIDG